MLPVPTGSVLAFVLRPAACRGAPGAMHPGRETHVDLSRKRVLVVDDHPGMLSTIRQALEMCGISGAHTVRSAQELSLIHI